MTMSLGAIRNHLLQRLGVMKKEIDYHETLREDFANESDVIDSLKAKYEKAAEAYRILNDIVTDGYTSDGDWVDSDFFD